MTIEISEETLRGLYLIMCGVPYGHSHSEVYPAAVPLMDAAHEEIIKIGKEKGWDNRGGDLK